MKLYGGLCLVGIFTMLTSVLIVAALVCANLINADNTTPVHEESTKYAILIPNKYQPEFVVLRNESSFDWENGFKKCGNPVEGCPTTPRASEMSSSNGSKDLNDTTSANETTNSSLKPQTNFKEHSILCRCDEECVRYGDCCPSVLKKLRKIPKDNHWRCVKLPHPQKYAVRMISKCPSNYVNNKGIKELCENKETSCPTLGFNSNQAYHSCHLLDVPVYSNKTGNLYKNTFCARCHHVLNHDLQVLKHNITCFSNYFEERWEWEEFLKRSYQRGMLRWEDPTNSSVQCNLTIEDLRDDVIEKVIPGVRFCSMDVKEECSLDLSQEENLIIHSLCFSYTLAVDLKNDEKYKNPHCAKCANPDIDIRLSPVCHRTRPRDRGGFFPQLIGPRTGPGEPAGPVGINILFHFSFDMEDGYVGYTSKCEEDEILDFIRHKCVPVICPKGYELHDGQCEKIELETSQDYESNDTTIKIPRDTNSSLSPDSTNTSEPCFLIIFHKGEYHQLENGSLAVNKSGNSGGVLVFQPGEYQQYEGDETNMSMSICAKHVENTFESSFAPALSYISNILLVISALCSLAHVVLYIILPKMRNLPGNNLLCLTSCLLISHFIFLTFINTSNHTVCVAASIIMHYFLLCGFVWMYVMSFDIWRTFSSEFLVRRYSGDSTKTFIKYSLFAWILPLLIVVLAVITDFGLPESWLLDAEFGPLVRKLRPMYGHNNLCWIGQRISLFVFFAFPVGLIILCNLVLFALTASTIWAQNKEGSRFINGSTPTSSGNKFETTGGQKKTPLQSRISGSTKKSDKIRFILYAKLALIMGLTWILGLLSGFTQWEWLWYGFVIFNGLQGTFIFVAFDCKQKVWRMIEEECGWRKKKSRKRDMGEGSSDTSRTRQTTTTTLSCILGGSASEKSKENDVMFGSEKNLANSI